LGDRDTTKGSQTMKPSLIIGMIIGYVLGARAGRERYENIVAVARRVAGSQTIQATAGVLQAQAFEAAERAKRQLKGGSRARMSGRTTQGGYPSDEAMSDSVGSNGHRA